MAEHKKSGGHAGGGHKSKPGTGGSPVSGIMLAIVGVGALVLLMMSLSGALPQL